MHKTKNRLQVFEGAVVEGSPNVSLIFFSSNFAVCNLDNVRLFKIYLYNITLTQNGVVGLQWIQGKILQYFN